MNPLTTRLLSPAGTGETTGKYKGEEYAELETPETDGGHSPFSGASVLS